MEVILKGNVSITCKSQYYLTITPKTLNNLTTHMHITTEL